MKANRIEFCKNDSDDTGEQFIVTYYNRNDNESIEFEADGSHVTFPITELDWLIEVLTKIKSQTTGE